MEQIAEQTMTWDPEISDKMIADAWNYYQNLKQPDTAETIAQAFTNPDGGYAYGNHKNEHL